MVRTSKKMHLGAFFHPTGNHIASWLNPRSQLDAGMNFRHYIELAQTAEKAKFDLIFLADSVATRDGNPEVLSRWPQYMVYFEPTMLLAGISSVTQNIGLVATATTSYNEPYNIARRFGSLDLMSGGRSGWNVVTSANASEAYNFDRDEHYGHEERYERAKEFVEVVRGLWDSWDDDAFVMDRTAARYFDPKKLHYLNHKGTFFKVRGPLNVARPPQGHPVFAQAGVSETGREFAAQIGEIVFTPLHTLEDAKAFSADLRNRMDKYYRDPRHLKILPGLNVIAGRTDEEAQEKSSYLQSLIHPDVGRQLLSTELGGFDLSAFPVDEPLPVHLIDTTKFKSSSGHRILKKAQEPGLTIRDLYRWYGGARGQRTIIGSPERIVDEMEEWFVAEGVDGFLIQPADLPAGLDEFVDLIIPELVRRGLFRSDYGGRTLRENLNLPRPVSRYAC
jgi:alkanesulfonate monooxygenase